MSAPAAEPRFRPAVEGGSLRFAETSIAGAVLIEPTPFEDERGDFTRFYDADEYAAAGLDPAVAQASLSRNRRAGTLRGMHFQLAPHEEIKLVRCARGAVHDVVVDLRPESPTYLRWEAFTLSVSNRRLVYVPKGLAHGFQTLEDETEIVYQMSEAFRPELQRGVRHDDPALGIEWPLPVAAISERDRGYPLIDRA